VFLSQKVAEREAGLRTFTHVDQQKDQSVCGAFQLELVGKHNIFIGYRRKSDKVLVDVTLVKSTRSCTRLLAAGTA
jgi:hypothetical protein